MQILVDCLEYLKTKDNLRLYACVFLKNHIHMVLSSNDLQKTMQSFKQYTANQILALLKKRKCKNNPRPTSFLQKSLS